MKNFLRKINWFQLFSIWAIFVSTVQIAWTLIYETENLLQQNHKFFLVICFIVAMLTYFGKEYIFHNLTQTRIKYKIYDQLNSIKKIVKSLDKEGKDFELKLLNWRIGVESTKAKNIASGAWNLNALQTYEFVRYVFGSVLKHLEEGDEYITLSNLNFWHRDKYGGTDFMASNITAAAMGVKIRRIIIVDSDILSHPELYREEILALKELVPEIKSQLIRNPKSAMNISMYFYESRNYQHDARPPVPFALIVNKDKSKYMAVLPSSIIESGNPSISVKLKNEQTMMDFNVNMDRYESIAAKTTKLISIDAMELKLNSIKI